MLAKMPIFADKNSVNLPMRTLYVSDLDGTLLGRDSRVSAASAALLNRLIDERGVLFTVATARTPATVVPLMQQVHVRLPLLTMTGAAWWDAAADRFTRTQALPTDVVEQVQAIFASHDLHPFVYRRRGDRLEAHHGGRLNDDEQHFVRERMHLRIKRFRLGAEADADSSDEALLIFAMNDYDRLALVHRDIISTVPCTAMFYHDIFAPATGLLEVYRHGCTKAAAMRELAAQLGADRVVAFGDNLNDLDMLRAADVAVAVANAVPEVRATAHIVIGDNTTDAVPRFIESFE